MKNNNFIIVSIILFFIFLVFGANFWSAIGVAISFYYLIKVIDDMGAKIPIIDLMTAMAALQWIVGPFIEYHNDVTHYKYHMYIDEESYMSFIVPAVILFRLGSTLFKDRINLEELGERVNGLLINYPRLPYILIGAGFIMPYIGLFMPPALGFVFFLLSNMKYIGAIYLIFSQRPDRWIIFVTTMAFTALASLTAGMFHDLLLWAVLTFTFISRELKLSFNRKLIFAIVGIFFAITIQSVKAQYREQVWGGYQGNKLALFTAMAIQQWSSGTIFTPTSETTMNVRLNQGWIISAIMYHVPAEEPFANGSTITDAITSSLLPRFLAPNKKKAGGQENFEKFTGLDLGSGTSMGISLAGEGWANYGYWGGLTFMFFWGLFISWFWRKLILLSDSYPTLLIWSPILFLQVVKAETEFVVVLNHLLKSAVLIFALLWFIKRQWGIRV